MKILSLFLVTLIIASLGCTTDQHIRKDNYYSYDWSLVGAATGQTNDAVKHHPIFAETKDSVEGTANYEKNVNYFIFGMLPTKHEIKLSEACGDKPFRQAYASQDFWQATGSVLTLGIYTPRKVRVWCGHEAASN